jgi:hypothetical protein
LTELFRVDRRASPCELGACKKRPQVFSQRYSPSEPLRARRVNKKISSRFFYSRWPLRLSVRTKDSQSLKSGPTPLGATSNDNPTEKSGCFFMRPRAAGRAFATKRATPLGAGAKETRQYDRVSFFLPIAGQALTPSRGRGARSTIGFMFTVCQPDYLTDFSRKIEWPTVSKKLAEIVIKSS